MATSRVIGEATNLYTAHGGCGDPIKAIMSIGYAVECSVIDIKKLNDESEKGCIFVAKDGTIYNDASAGAERAAQYKIVPTGLITKFNNVPLLASFYKDRNKEWHGVYVGTLSKLFETYKQFYGNSCDFSDQYMELCYGDKPLYNIYGFGLSEVVKNEDNYILLNDSDSVSYTVGDIKSPTIGESTKLTNLKNSLERSQKQLRTLKLSKSKRKKLELKIKQLQSDIEKEQALVDTTNMNNTETKESVNTEGLSTTAETATETTATDETETTATAETETTATAETETEVTATAETATEATATTETNEQAKTPKKVGRKAPARPDGTVKRRFKTKAEIEEELIETKKRLDECKVKLEEYEKSSQEKAEEASIDSANIDEYIKSICDKLTVLEEENKRLSDENKSFSVKNKSLLEKNTELTKQANKLANRNTSTTISSQSTQDKTLNSNRVSTNAKDVTDEASEVFGDDFMELAGIEPVCDAIYNKLLDKERWINADNENTLKFYIKPLMQFVYGLINRAKPGDPEKSAGNGYIFSTYHKKLLINTNLIDTYGNSIYIIDHTPNEKSYTRKTVTVMQSKSALVADGFSAESIRQLPGLVKFFDKSKYIFSACIEDFDLEDDEHLDHIINERRMRFPYKYKDVSAKIIADKLKSSIAQAIQISEIDYRYVMPMYNTKLNELEFLIPFYLDNHYGQKPELAIIVAKKHSFWKVFTVIKSEYAYYNARLLCKPDNNVF